MTGVMEIEAAFTCRLRGEDLADANMTHVTSCPTISSLQYTRDSTGADRVQDVESYSPHDGEVG